MKIIRPLLVEVRWKVPAVTNGNIARYTVYAIPLVLTEPTRGKRQAEPATLPKTIKMVRLEFLKISTILGNQFNDPVYVCMPSIVHYYTLFD